MRRPAEPSPTGDAVARLDPVATHVRVHQMTDRRIRVRRMVAVTRRRISTSGRGP
jgi:hypothetical protein